MTHVSFSMKRFAELLGIGALLMTSLGCGEKSDLPKRDATADTPSNGNVDREGSVAQSEMTFQVQDPQSQGSAVEVQLDSEALRTNGLSKEDVIGAFEVRISSLIGSDRPKEALPPPGVVFVTRLFTPKQYENLVLKANADGEIVRLKDVAKLKFISDHKGQEAETSGGGK